VGYIINHFTYENEEFSLLIAGSILKGLDNLYPPVDESAKSYMHAVNHLLNIKDSLCEARMSWLLGIHQLKVTTTS